MILGASGIGARYLWLGMQRTTGAQYGPPRCRLTALSRSSGRGCPSAGTTSHICRSHTFRRWAGRWGSIAAAIRLQWRPARLMGTYHRSGGPTWPDAAPPRPPISCPPGPGPHCQTGSALAGDGELAGVAGQAQSPVGHGTFQRGSVTCAPWAAPAGRGCSTSGGTTGKPASRQAANPPSRSVAFRKPSRCRAAAARLD